MKSTISVIILTYNERLHIRRCLTRLAPLGADITLIDCHSDDGTQAIAEELGARVIEHTWPGNQAAQMKWAHENVPLRGDWILRLDADEYLTPELIDEIKSRLDILPPTVTGVTFPLIRVFMGRRLRHGNPTIRLLRLWRNGKAVCEQREMDEHMTLLDGEAIPFRHGFVDHNLNDLVWWTQKHLNYAQREIRTALGPSALGELDPANKETAASASTSDISPLTSDTPSASAEGSSVSAREHQGAVNHGLNLSGNAESPSDIIHLTSDVPSASAEGPSVSAREHQGAVNHELSNHGHLVDTSLAKRRLKSRYAKLPLFWRSFAYFLYRYFIKLGFLDGKPGFMWAFLQGFWYRTLIDSMVYEKEIMDMDNDERVKSGGGQ